MIAFMPCGPSVAATARVSFATPRPKASRAASSCSIIFGIGLSSGFLFVVIVVCSDDPPLGRVHLGTLGQRCRHIKTRGQKAPAQCAVELGVDADSPEGPDIGLEAVGLETPSLRRQERWRIGAAGSDDLPPLQIASHQVLSLLFDGQHAELGEAYVP